MEYRKGGIEQEVGMVIVDVNSTHFVVPSLGVGLPAAFAESSLTNAFHLCYGKEKRKKET